jgi:hypothetical protein
MDKFKYAPMFQMGKDETEYYLLTKDYVSVTILAVLRAYLSSKLRERAWYVWPMPLCGT